MFLNLEKLVKKHQLKINGVIHIGAHIGQEYSDYQKLSINNIIFFEPIKSTFNKLISNVKNDNVIFINKALGNDNKKITMYTENINDGQSSSILEPKEHLKLFPYIHFNGIEEVDMIKLDDFDFTDFDFNNFNNFNMINIDVQGYELEVFKGSYKTFKNIDYIYTEINGIEIYKNCCLVKDLDYFLSDFNFERVDTFWYGENCNLSIKQDWGDALYIKNKYKI